VTEVYCEINAKHWQLSTKWNDSTLCLLLKQLLPLTIRLVAAGCLVNLLSVQLYTASCPRNSLKTATRAVLVSRCMTELYSIIAEKYI